MARACEPIDFISNTKTSNQLTIDDAIPGNYTNANGEFTLQQVDVIEQEFRNAIVTSTEGNSLTNAVEKFPTFYEDLNTVNTNLFDSTSRDAIDQLTNDGSTDTTILNNRIDSGRKITPFEFAEFITDNFFTPTEVATGFSGGIGSRKRWMNSLNCWFTGPGGFYNKLLGGFCNNVAQLYAGVALFEALQDGVKDALEALTKIKNIENILQAIIDKITVQNLINAVKGAVAGIIKGAIDCVKMAIMSFDPFLILNNGGPVPSYALSRTIESGIVLKDKALDTFTEDFVDGLVKKVENLIDYAVNLFANPSVEEIEFLMSRFCGFTSAIGIEMEKVKEPLEKFEAKVNSARETAKASSRVVSAQALESGRSVWSDPDRADNINNAKNDWEAKTGEQTITQEDANGLPTFESIMKDTDGRIKMRRGNWYDFYENPSDHWLGGNGKSTLDVRVKLMKLQKRFGKKFEIISMYRSKAYNDSVRERYKAAGKPAGPKNNYGVAFSSQHMNGKAIDITWAGFNSSTPQEREDFINMANDVGFIGTGYYPKNGFFHIDTHKKRRWTHRG